MSGQKAAPERFRLRGPAGQGRRLGGRVTTRDCSPPHTLAGRGHAPAGPLLFLRRLAGSHLTCPISTQLWTTPSLVYDHGTTGERAVGNTFAKPSIVGVRSEPAEAADLGVDVGHPRARTPSSSTMSTGPRTLPTSQTTSAACRSSTLASVSTTVHRRPGRARTAAAGWCRRGCRCRRSGSCAASGRSTRPPTGRRLEHDSVGADEQRIVGAAAGGLALRRHVDRVRQRLDAAEQPRRVGERGRPVAARQRDHRQPVAAQPRVVGRHRRRWRRTRRASRPARRGSAAA